MLEKTNESQNEVIITGILNELDIVEGKSAEGQPYVRGTAYIRVDQEIEGEVKENIIPVKMFSMMYKKGTKEVSKLYTRILNYKNEFKSLAIVDSPSEASRVTVTASISENSFYNESTDSIITGFQVSSNFIKKAKDSDKEGAKFVFSGVVINTNSEVNSDGEETGRLFVKLGVIGYGGKINIITLTATGSKKEHIENNWETKDTVKVAGVLNMSKEVKVFRDDTGFGEPIEKTKPITCNELIITGGSASGLEDDYSYDATDIATLLEERKVYLETLKTKAKNKSKSNSKSSSSNSNEDFGF